MSLKLLITLLVKLANMNSANRMKFGLLVLLFSVVEAPEFQLKCPNQPVEAKEGDSVILPCYTDPRVNLIRVEWVVYHQGKDEDVHLYRQGEDDFTDQGEEYKNRTSVFKEKLSSGNCSLKLMNLMKSDSGIYQASVKMKEENYSCNVTLTNPVEENKDEKRIKGGHTGIGTAGIIGIVAAVLLIGGIVGGTLSWCKKKQPNQPNEGNVPSLEGEELKNLNSL